MRLYWKIYILCDCSSNMKYYTSEEIMKKRKHVIYLDSDSDSDEEVYRASKHRPPSPDPQILSESESSDELSKNEDDDTVWEGHVVMKMHVDILSFIKGRYPQTFEGVKFSPTETDSFAYNMLAEFVTCMRYETVDYLEIEDIGKFKNMMAQLEDLNFKIDWLREPIEKLEKSKFLIPHEIMDLKKKVQEKENELKNLQSQLGCIVKVSDLL